ncbi:MAG TPA: hypothetical protein VMW77_07005 [Methanoregula sp.]|nr:hypothetical protein [Methanoregula sp.]
MQIAPDAGNGYIFPSSATIAITIIADSTGFPSTMIVKTSMTGRTGDPHEVRPRYTRLAVNE